MRPAWILTLLILGGWILGVLGSYVVICPAIAGFPCEIASRYLAQDNLLVLYYHEYFQLGTSIFITSSIEDAAFNAIAVLILDRFIDSSIFNDARYFCIFLAAALLGNLLTLLFGPFYLSAGASGGIFGLYAAVFSFSWAQEKRVDLTMLGLFLLIFVSSDLFPNTNWLAHLGGSIAGFVAGPLLYAQIKPQLDNYQVAQSTTRFKLVLAAAVSLGVTAIILQFFFQFLF